MKDLASGVVFNFTPLLLNSMKSIIYEFYWIQKFLLQTIQIFQKCATFSRHFCIKLASFLHLACIHFASNFYKNLFKINNLKT